MYVLEMAGLTKLGTRGWAITTRKFFPMLLREIQDTEQQVERSPNPISIVMKLRLYFLQRALQQKGVQKNPALGGVGGKHRVAANSATIALKKHRANPGEPGAAEYLKGRQTFGAALNAGDLIVKDGIRCKLKRHQHTGDVPPGTALNAPLTQRAV